MALRSWSPPERFDEFRLVQPIGAGAMGKVWLAQDLVLERPVAVKFVAARRLDEEARRRFRTEARAIARLTHPNVLTVHRVGEVDGRPYLVTELVRGRALGELELPLEPAKLLPVALGLAGGLAAAHRAGVVHRDVKPANVMLTEDGVVKLLDFGLAALRPPAAGPAVGESEVNDAVASSPSLTGTPLYMAPEVLAGGPATRASDLWSVGAVLYELASGTPARLAVEEGTRFEDWIATAPPALSGKATGLDPRFAALLGRCLEPEPQRRFASAEELHAALIELTQQGTAPVAVDGEGNPYRGLRAFDLEHRALYFGRSTEAQTLIERVLHEKLLVVVGDSGVGKSSLCRAGLLPALTDPRSAHRFRVVSLMPGRHPLAALAAALGPVLNLSGPEVQALSQSSPRELAVAVRAALGDGRLLVFIDQLEELFSVGAPEEVEPFAQVLGALMAAGDCARVVGSMRGDFVTRLAALPGVGDEIPRALFVLRPMSRAAMRAAVVGPARQKGFAFESEALIDVLVESAARAPGGLAALQFAMAEVWERRDEARRMVPTTALEALGGVGGALARHADGVIAALLPTQRETARRILMRLVTREGMRVRRTAHELDAEHPEVAPVLDALVRGRLLVASEAEGVTSYELAHEALVEGWQALRSWLYADLERREHKERVEAAAAEWERLGRPAGALYLKTQLDEVAPIAPPELSDRARAFVAASRGRRRRELLGRVATVAAVVLIVGTGGVVTRLKARADLAELVAEHQRLASVSLQSGTRLAEDAGRARDAAFALFNEVKEEEAEVVYQTALELEATADEELINAIRALQAAVTLDPGNASLRAAVADALAQRIDLADRAHAMERRGALLERLHTWDVDGSRRNRLSARPKLRLSTTPGGAAVRLQRYELHRGRRELTEPIALGATPLAGVEVAAGPGSYLVTVERDGHAPLRVPLLLAAGETVALELELIAASRVPEGMVVVPPGRFLLGSAHPEPTRRGLLGATPLREAWTHGFLIARTEVTFAQWLEFLGALTPKERAARTPSVGQRDWVGLELVREADEAWRLTLLLDGERHTAREGEPLRNPKRTRRAEQDWRRFPVSGISRRDAEAYLAWLDRTGRVPGARLCTEWEWERAARGADGRDFPHGDWLEPDDANFDLTYGRTPGAFGPDEVGSHPVSVSPFGLLDMTGNVYEWVRSVRGDAEAIVRGGSWYYDSVSNLIVNRTPAEPNARDLMVGLRVCADAPR